jgi:phage protein D
MANGNSGVVSARPGFTVGGQDNPDLAAGLLSLLIVETVSGLYRCEALFGNWGSSGGGTGYRYFDRLTLDFGKTFQVKLGTSLLFDGRITAIEGRYPEGAPPQINVLAEDRLQDLRMTRRTRTFIDLDDSGVFSQVASDHGLQSQASLQGPKHKVLAQVNQSDLAFLRDRARALGAEVWIEGSTLHAAPRGNRASGQPVELALGARLREFSVAADLAGQRDSVTVGGWDVAAKAAQTAQADDSLISGELEGGDSGASILSTALGSRKEALVHGVPLSSAEAQAQAEAAFRLIARRFVVGRGRAQTDERLRVGAFLDLKGLGPLFSGKYYLSEVRHMFDGAAGLRSEFSAERPSLGKP